MSSNSRHLHLLLLAAAVATPGALAAQQYSCPAYSAHHPLETVSILDGPPSENAILMPDTHRRTTSSWDVGYVYKAGRQVYLICHYAHTPPTADVTVQAKDKVAACTFRTHKAGVPAEATCK